jgi:hypothetical protein
MMDQDRKRTAKRRKTTQESQLEPVSPMKSRRFRTLQLAAIAGESREKTAFLGWPFSSVPGCSWHAGPQKDRSEGRKGPQDRKVVG